MAQQHSVCSLNPPQYSCPSPDLLQIQFSGVNVENCGENYSKSLFSELNAVTYTEAVQSEKYTLVLTDPDAPRHEEGEAWLHWIHTGLKGSDLSQGKLTGHDLVVYNPPTPPKGTGTHRYALFLYREEGQQQDTSVRKRGRFSLHQYAERNGLCGPLAMNMFTTKF
ncbi:hypothetical protein Pmani_006656 [Petrolisthes manimaculis]|uniref:Phosphatidylethanolamine-binding protein n=1 Tax=Petrolisthes manimaculis TaxID=1843537 RepID=A0AAE1QA22_9EUCA|nr:hypothetical protein Pmani_006656 [Petrolisthes manimaculis]